MTITDHWYYPRAELAKSYVDLMVNGVMDRMTIFAPRRMGKTLFLLNDLMPEAKSRRWKVIYISVWGDKDNPHEYILKSLQTQLEKNKRMLPFGSKHQLKKFRLSAPLGISGEFEFSDNPQSASSNVLMDIDQTIELLAKKSKGKLLLLLDEIQHLTTSDKFEPLTYALRSTLDRLTGQLKVVFTGSSRSAMQSMFGDSRAPFYRFGDQVPFPILDTHFINHIIKVFNKITSLHIDEKRLNAAFKKFDHNPAYIVSVVKTMVLDPDLSIKNAVNHTLNLIAIEKDYDKTQKQLKPLDIEVYGAVINGKSIYSKTLLDKYSKAINKSVTKTLVQRSVSRLLNHQLISLNDRGEYNNESPGFMEWLKDSNY